MLKLLFLKKTEVVFSKRLYLNFVKRLRYKTNVFYIRVLNNQQSCLLVDNLWFSLDNLFIITILISSSIRGAGGVRVSELYKVGFPSSFCRLESNLEL